MGQPEELLFPTLAAEALGVSPATLRRYAQAWEKAIGPLPRAPGGGRLWPRAALARLKAAKDLAAEEGLPLGEALLRAEGEAPLVATARPEREALALLREVLARLGGLEAEVRALREELRQLRPRFTPSRPWWMWWRR